MNYNQQETFTKSKSNKTLEIISSKSKITFFSKITNFFSCISNCFNSLTNKINKMISNCSMLTQFTLILIPFSIIMMISVFCIHIVFYDSLYIFNFYKGIKEEFIDSYITEIDDIHSEIDSFVIKENYIDTEDQMFFQVYFKELSSIGLLDNVNIKTFPNISENSDILYSTIGKVDKMDSSGYSVPKESAKKNIDDRTGDSIGELAKLYYYMTPFMSYGAFKQNIFINTGFFIAYEFDQNRKITDNNALFFIFPKETNTFNENDNFTPSNNLINPLVSKELFRHTKLISSSYYFENWFLEQDSKFRESVNLTKEGNSKITLAHLNYEENGNINKSLIISSQQNINRNNKHYMINIIFFLKQNQKSENETNDYSSFIIQYNPNFKKIESEKYSDNETFVILKSDITEFSLANLDYQYFHYGLYNKNNSFYKNGISFDSFNLDYLSDPLKYYSSIEDLNTDLKYLSTLYLYKAFFQSVPYSKFHKNRQEVILLNFNDEEKVQKICSEINLKSYKEYMEKSGINCFDNENSLFYDDEYYKEVSMAKINAKFPNCGCMPLYCSKNFKDINNKFDFDDISYSSKINLPTKCINSYKYYLTENNSNFLNNINSSAINLSKYIYKEIASKLKIPSNDYIKIKRGNLTQLPGYYLFIISQINFTYESFEFHFYTTVIRIEIITLVFSVSMLCSCICIIIVYVNLRRYSLIIEEFKQKYELYVFHSEDGQINNSNNNNKIQNHKYYGEKILEEQNSNIENIQNENFLGRDINDNENTLLDDLFSMFCKLYRLSRKDIENYYSKKEHESKDQMKLKMMTEKNELFKLLTMFSIYAPIFRLNLSLDYKMYNYSKIIKKYDQYVTQVVNINKEQTRLTQNILYELLSTENISDSGLITNLNFKYISNIKAELKENSIQNALFINVINKMKGKNDDSDENEININDIFFILKDGDEKQNIKLILKQKNELIEMFKYKFESDDYINYNKLESSFNFFLINSYYKYLKQIILEENNS